MTVETSKVTTWLLAALAVLCNAGAQALIKQASHGVQVAGSASTTWFGLQPLPLGMALLLYAVSFALTAWVYARMPLSVASPLMAGAIFVLVSVASVAWFAEAMTALRVAGMVCILVGMVLLARSA
ncbi:MAG: hypothetical protein RL014_2734 [Pseudomonadota bacterium]|jgi:multidrug transporter EmrE-like cation transporter